MSQLDSNAIKEIVKLTTTAFSGENLPLTECPVALLPDNVNIESLERFMTERFRFRGVMTTTSIDDFVEYSKGYAWICPYISRHLLSLNPLLACCRRYSRGER
ncbi:YfdQ family protein [Escherichia coli]|nr:DUF2303 family protein [Escherichia coli]MCF4022152.1 YfdQ family protein [Escherichia coli]